MWHKSDTACSLFVLALAGTSLIIGHGAAASELIVPATVVKVVDGDTIKVDAFPWPGHTIRVSVRIDGIDTPEIRGKCQREKELALAARDAVVELLGGGKVVLGNVRHGKYAGRVVARVVLPDGRDVGEEMLRRGLARSYDGRGRRKGWCGVNE